VNQNLFDYFETLGTGEGHSPWAARSPRRPQPGYDLKLLPRSRDWQDDALSLQALADVEAQPWVAEVLRRGDEVRLRVSDEWLESLGAALEAGGSDEASLSDLRANDAISVQFWDANATKALHVGHLRNLAIGNALAASLEQAGARVERRSRISDVGRAMGEAMAGVMRSEENVQGFSDGGVKSDHFVGLCYADYVASGNGVLATVVEDAEDSLTREVDLHDDDADELVRHALEGDPDAVELWYRTRAWVIAGQRRTLARLGIAFDRVLFESDFLTETAELTAAGLRSGVLRRREDGVIVFDSGCRELEEVPLVRSDGVPTQHMRSFTYCVTGPELEGMASLQVTGAEWTPHVTTMRKLAAVLPGKASEFHPNRSIFHGMVAQQKRALSSSAGAMLIDDLADWIEDEIDCSPDGRQVRAAHPNRERLAAQVALGYFLPYPVTPDIEFDRSVLLSDGDSLGWDLARARARHASSEGYGELPVRDDAYRFAVLQSELYRRYLRLAVERLDVRPIAHYLRHLSLWFMEIAPAAPVERVVHTLLDRGARGLGLEGGR
jgi:arginyl-tRNA synthetase